MATTQDLNEQRVVLRNVSWETYERLLADHEDRSAPRFTYDRGDLEIMSPQPIHEMYKRAIESLIDALAVEWNLDIDGRLASTTFKREDIQRGFEADSCFYVEEAPRVRGKERIDLRVDRPPDLVVEIEITSPTIPKLPIFAQFGVPEVWRYDGERLHILVLVGDRYVESPQSSVLPGLSAVAVSDILREVESLEWVAWLRRVREGARELRSP